MKFDFANLGIESVYFVKIFRFIVKLMSILSGVESSHRTISRLTSDVWYAELHQICGWSIGTEEGANNGYSDNEEELVLRESERSWHSNEHTPLHGDTPSYTCAYSHTRK